MYIRLNISMAHLLDEKERHMFGDRFICALYSLVDGTWDERNADVVYTELKLGAILNETTPDIFEFSSNKIKFPALYNLIEFLKERNLKNCFFYSGMVL